MLIRLLVYVPTVVRRWPLMRGCMHLQHSLYIQASSWQWWVQLVPHYADAMVLSICCKLEAQINKVRKLAVAYQSGGPAFCGAIIRVSIYTAATALPQSTLTHEMGHRIDRITASPHGPNAQREGGGAAGC